MLREYEKGIKSLNLFGTNLENPSRANRNFVQHSDEENFAECLKWQRSVCLYIFNHIERIPKKDFYIAIEICVQPKLLAKKQEYSEDFYKEYLHLICKTFKCLDIFAFVCVGHAKFFEVLRNPNNNQLYAHSKLEETKSLESFGGD